MPTSAQACLLTRGFRAAADPTVVGTELGGSGGPLEMASTIVKGFVNSNRTHFIYQPAIGSFYEGGQYSFKELVSARDPWSGWIHYDAGPAILQHFSERTGSRRGPRRARRRSRLWSASSG